jgi:hypothetical protein
VLLPGSFADEQGAPVHAGLLAVWFSTDPSVAPSGAGGPAPPSERFAVPIPPNRAALAQVFFASSRPPDGPNQLFPENVVIGTSPLDVGTVVVHPGCLLAGAVVDPSGAPSSLSGAVAVYQYVRGPQDRCVCLGAGFSVIEGTGRFAMNVLPGFGR